MNRIVFGTLAGIGIAGMATAPGAYAAQSSTEVTTRAPAQFSENIVVAEVKKKGGGAGGGGGMAGGGGGGGMAGGGGGGMGGVVGGMGGGGMGGGGMGGGGMGGGGMGQQEEIKALKGGMGGGGMGGVVGGMGGSGMGGIPGGMGGIPGGMGGIPGGMGGIPGGMGGIPGGIPGGMGGMGGVVGGMGGMGGPGVTVIGGRPVVIISGPRYIRWGGRNRRIIAISALPVAIGAIAISGRRYYATGYPAVAATPNVCTGVTEEGCELRLQDIPMDGGGTATVCVQYCLAEDGAPAPQ